MMSPHEINRWPHDDRGAGRHDPEEDEPSEISSEDVSADLERIDEELRQSGKFPEGPDRPSEEDVRRLIEETLGQEIAAEHKEPKIPPEAENYISGFLRTMNVQGASKITPADVKYFWEKMGRHEPYIQDYVFTIMALKSNLSLSRYPTAVSINDMYDYAEDISSPEEIRQHFQAQAVENLTEAGFDPKKVTDYVFGDEVGHVPLAEATRFIGWVITLPGMGNIMARTQQYVEEHDLEKMNLQNVATNVILSIYDAIDILEKKTYRAGYPLEEEARPNRDAALQALYGINEVAKKLLLGGKSKPTT